ncbi:MFS transporter [Microbispora sp. CA-102843]|uniref:MFS transporter n=1 Tax=Microbispora sp. CA-102843 TaxID=3239952 RepID=UPI003D8E6F5D
MREPSTATTLDEMPLRPFHLRIAAVVGGGMFIDGYILGIVIFAFPSIPEAFGMTSVWDGLVSAAPLIGLFTGGLVFGRLTDRFGRRDLFRLHLLAMVVVSALQVLTSAPWQLFVIRLVLGLAIGGDYAIGPGLLAEFTPRKLRTSVMSSLGVLWALGYLVSTVVGYYVVELGGDNAWKWALATSAVPSLIVMIMRTGSPESPRWLISKGRAAEARRIVDRWLGPEVVLDGLAEAPQAAASWRRLFAPDMWRRTAVAGLFWMALAIPNFSLFIFLPDVLSALHVKDEFVGTVLPSAFALVGTVVGIFLLPRMGRRTALIGFMAVLTVISLWIGLVPGSPWITVALFVLFGMLLALVGNLEFIYPSELFPTELRASGLGIASAVSRIGAAVGTFLLPIGLESMGVVGVMVATALVLAFGIVVTAAWAPETNGLALDGPAASSPRANSPAPPAADHPA